MLTERLLFHQHDHVLEQSVLVLPVDIENGLLFGEICRKGQYLHRLDVTELVPEDCRYVFVDNEDIINHGVHLGIPE